MVARFQPPNKTIVGQFRLFEAIDFIWFAFSKKSKSEILKSVNQKTGIQVTSPIIGTAYHSPEPGAKKFVEVGKKIKKGDTVMIVEAMKTMNHVPSSADGIVKEICVEDGQPVEFGQTIIILE